MLAAFEKIGHRMMSIPQKTERFEAMVALTLVLSRINVIRHFY